MIAFLRTNTEQEVTAYAMTTNVSYVTGFWATNIGNSFYNLGALNALGQVYGRRNVYAVPDLPHWYWSTSNSFDPLPLLSTDICFFSGPGLTAGITKYESAFDRLTSAGSKLAFISAGAADYTPQERDAVLAFLSRYTKAILCISTRDHATYQLYQDSDIPTYDGICTSMFLNDEVNVPDLQTGQYAVFNFPPKLEPQICLNDDAVTIRERPDRSRPQKAIAGLPIVRTNSSPFSADPNKIFYYPNTFYSDLPHGYLAIYKSARYVFTEKVHTCCATLILGGTAMYIPRSQKSTDRRQTLLARIGVADILERPRTLDFSHINSEKRALLAFLRGLPGAPPSESGLEDSR